MKPDFSSTDYILPPRYIANKPAKNRGNDKLLIYNSATDTVRHDVFYNIKSYIPKDTACILNKSSVIPARIRLKKSSGGIVEVLFLLNEELHANGQLRVMVDRKVTEGTVLSTKKNKQIGYVAKHSEKSIFTMQLTIPRQGLVALLQQEGAAPIPKYIKHSPLSRLEQIRNYQTVYARVESQLGSVAAPTAGLHFTKNILQSLKSNGVQTHYITLHVGLGTFAPLTSTQIQTKKLHEEMYSVSDAIYSSLQQAKTNNRPILAVGTTTVRTLETISHANQRSGSTDIFIYPPHSFYYPTMLLTNFHLPHTSLMLLVQAFLQHKHAQRNLVQLYNEAIVQNYRFYSFGDSMLIL
ncbi:tRNA preQ1(34) S-adenosylmethionine ribosyltransferase-isomerase QueA [Candidatus Roizmanbacteria bacterium CG10_big_fil_rev_8_21_14_0_10_39_6]|uniref:tRNA preQ1(34) S-adenosylmethionine ribosyltransferase-isomerase QueA n=1 Tax=Candidatus Roizmanbacteria bacterium CG10_big_fil_rev_8_21_14_0_10_39_6 TaxID=1974853 RepID=A0A2M8KSZ5_9BACT|nr:MAG: tRNA preQ1(34) S-adenosylmethionine ribosyltransferase-isomerase QueA [Candidatus Roizmanbacteria bacterium CG10_big_fil_rev_8_21_14_0_10_39_6]